ncbi:hypothetical protein IWX85_000250 [Polaromonas sp. CG_9.11]|nr:hypothetical protein [Polaromonas sp. CG_9.11]
MHRRLTLRVSLPTEKPERTLLQSTAHDLTQS